MEDNDLLLVDLQDWAVGASNDVVGQDLLGGLGSGMPVACGDGRLML